jgi:pyrroline-5-carboxylate reductase
MTGAEIPEKIGVIGAGVMGEALISALIAYGVAPSCITISEKREDRARELVARYGVVNSDLAANVETSDALLLVVKPQDMATLLDEIKIWIRPQTLVISFAAGKQIEFIRARINTMNPVIRVMPNTATLVQEGMAAMSLGSGVSSQQSQFVSDFLGATGRVVTVAEGLLDAVTAVSGSGPAYFFYFVESMIKAGTEMGLTDALATDLTIQTIVGAAKLLTTSNKSATTLRENVTSPNGVTAEAIALFDSAELPLTVKNAMFAARNRSKELA